MLIYFLFAAGKPNAGFLVAANSAFSRFAAQNGNVAPLRLLFNEKSFPTENFFIEKK